MHGVMARPSETPRLILASGSQIRQFMLRQAGIDFGIEVPSVDEEEIRHSFQGDRIPVEDCAIAIAELKAASISRKYTGIYVLGCDQILDHSGLWLRKPDDQSEAREQLRSLSGQTHRLISAAVIFKNGSRVWHGIDEAKMTMRKLSPAFIDRYVEEHCPEILTSVGGYQIEKVGIQLFERIDGDFFTVQGLPLLRLLAYLRDIGLCPR